MVALAGPPAATRAREIDFGSEDDYLLAQQIRDPAIETVDEQTSGFSPGSGRTVRPDDESFGDRVRERWQNVRDPAIETVDEMTRKKKDGDKKDGAKKDEKKDGKKDKEKEKKKEEWYDNSSVRLKHGLLVRTPCRAGTYAQ